MELLSSISRVFQKHNYTAVFKFKGEAFTGGLIECTLPPAVKYQAVQRVFQAGGGYLQQRVNTEERNLLAGT